MKKFKSSLFFVLVIALCTGVIYFIVNKSALMYNVVASNNSISANYFDDFLVTLKHNLSHPLAILLVQIITIIFVARFFGFICRKIGQPTVIGEMLAGIALGPSLFGAYFPDFFNTLFPQSSIVNLKFLSQIGLIFFMFVIGMELDLKVFRTKIKEAFIISHTSIIVSYTLGLGLALFLFEEFAPKNVSFLSFGLFLGVAMSIAAFPVLARIVQERGLTKTKLGSLVITCAAIDDITAWCLLAGVIAIVKAGNLIGSLYVISMVIGYLLIMILLLRPFLKRIGNFYSASGKIPKPIVAIFFLTLIISSYMTEIIGIHALVGAFVAGVIMPEDIKFRKILIDKVEDVSLVLLLPLFFVVTGLNTKIGLLNTSYLWEMTGVIILVAVGAKFFSSFIATKVVGNSWRDSLTLGVLMNTRGLMELIVLNIGLELGVLSPTIFAMMVIMALSTTFMTGPLLNTIDFLFNIQKRFQKKTNDTEFDVLISFENISDSSNLLKVGSEFVGLDQNKSSLTALFVPSINEINPYKIEEFESQCFEPLIDQSRELNIKITTLFRTSQDVENEVVNVSNLGGYEFTILSMNPSIYEGTIFGKFLGLTSKIINPENLINTITGKEKLLETKYFDEKTNNIINKSEHPIALYLDKGIDTIKKIGILFFDRSDKDLIKLVNILNQNSKAKLTLFDFDNCIKDNELEKKNEYKKDSFQQNDFLMSYDLVILSVNSWKKMIVTQSNWLNFAPSLLIVKP